MGGNIACTFYTVASGISVGGVPNRFCSTSADKPKDEGKDDAPPIFNPPKTRGGKCSCNCRANAGRDVLSPPKPRFARMTLPDNPRCKETAKAACRIAKKRLAVTSVHHEQAICRYNNQKPFPVNR